VKHTCFPAEDAERILALDPDDGERAGAMRCPRCSALISAYTAFVDAAELPGSSPAAAQGALGDFVDSLVSPHPGSRAAHRPSRLERFTKWLRPVPALAGAAALVVVTVVLVGQFGPREHETILRGTPHVEIGGESAAWRSGRLHLEWAGVADSDSYSVIVLSQDLSELLRFGPVSETQIDIERSELPDGEARGTLLYVVVASRNGDETARSIPRPVPLQP